MGVCVVYVVVAGGVTCQCPPPEPDGEIVEVDAAQPGPECYCVAPGSSCQTDGDCRTQIKYCIFLTCQGGRCLEPTEAPPAEPVPEKEAEPYEPPPSCPAQCNSDADCKPELCGEYIYCKDSEKRCVKSNIVRP